MNKAMPLLLAAALTLFSGWVLAADEAKKTEKNYTLQEMTVTSTKIVQPEKNITQKTDVLDEETVGNLVLPNRNLSEILRYLPGTFVDTLSRNDANWGSYGGLGPKYNGYLLDGLPIDAFVDTMSLDAAPLEKVEVQRGPASVMYSNYLSMDFAGNQSPLAGITNLVLKDRIEQPMTRIGLGYGSYNTYNGRIYHQGKQGNFHYLLGAGYEKSDYTDYGTENSWLGMLDDPEYQKTKLYLKTTYFFDRNDHKVSLFLHHTQHTGDVGRPNRDYDHRYDTVNLTYTNRLTAQVLGQFKIGYRHYNRRWGSDNYPTDLRLSSHDGVKQKILPADLTFSVNHGPNGLLTLGSDYQTAVYETYTEPDGTRNKINEAESYNFGLYAQEKMGWKDWIFRVGGRFNYTGHRYTLISGAVPGEKEKTWANGLWSLGVKYNPSQNLAFYANMGTSFQAPSAKSVGGTLKASDQGVSGKNGQLPNPDLKPEKGKSYDMGAEIIPVTGLRLGVRGFYTVLDDAIVETVVSRNPSQSKSVNAGKTRSYGLELEARQAIGSRLEGFSNFTYTQSQIQNNLDPDQDGNEVPFVPDYVFNLGLTGYLPWDFKVSAYLQAVGKYYDGTSKSGRRSFGPYETVNLKIQKVLFKNKGYKAEAHLDLINLTDNKYEMPWQFKDPGFSAFAGVDLFF
jgi:outer membrane receptor protein involved in Fe transport